MLVRLGVEMVGSRDQTWGLRSGVLDILDPLARRGVGSGTVVPRVSSRGEKGGACGYRVVQDR